MIFLNPQALWLIALPVGMALYFFLRPRKDRSARMLPLSAPVGVIRPRSQTTKWLFRGFFCLSIVGFALLVVSIARPARVTKWLERWKEGIDIVMVLDVSESMDATDFQPNRIEVAKQVLHDFVKRRTNDRLGLVLFGGEAVTKVPLTHDYDFLLSQLKAVQLRELKQGTAIGVAIANGVGRLRKSEAKTRVIILLTDGDSNVGSLNPITAANLAKEEGIKVYTIGIGKSTRVVVPIYAYDVFGRKTQLLTKVPSYLNPELLQNISSIANGKSYMATDSRALSQILAEIDELEKSKTHTNKMEKKDEIYLAFAGFGTLMLFLVIALTETRYRRRSYATTH